MTTPPRSRVAVALLGLWAAVFGAAALVCAPPLARTIFGSLPGSPSSFPAVSWRLALWGLGLSAAAWAFHAAPALRVWAARVGVQRALLALTFGLAPLVLAENVLAALLSPAEAKTTIFVRDPELGWRHRPDAVDVWDRHEVRINAKGLRGPDVPYERTPGRTRLLFLGDSVTFGDGLANDEDTLPPQVAAAVTPRHGRAVEAINAGVSGYSPWQEARYFETEGWRYAPDVAVVTFVLNDVTEKFELVRFGGSGEGWQLGHAHASTSRPVQWLLETNLARAAQKAAGRLRFGADARAGARAAEQLTVRSLVDDPDSRRVADAWDVTLRELDDLVAACRTRSVPLLLVASPFAFQLEREGLDAPQRRLARFAAERNLAYLDLLPPLVADARREQRSPRFYFLDSNHFSPSGTALVAALVADALVDRGLLPHER